jgi:putative tricarboxylic transport membrane protein
MERDKILFSGGYMEAATVFQSFGLISAHLFSFQGVLMLMAGVLLGLVMGAVPGMGAMTTLALVIPFTYGWDPLDAFLLLPAIFGSTTVGGSVAAILINTPGTPENIATTLDGYPLAKQGRAAEALAISGLSSLTGSVLGLIVFFFVIPFLVPLSLLFGPPEVFWLGIFTVVVIATVTGGSFLMNICAGGLGFVLSCIGMGPVSGVPRFSFGISYLWGGIELIPAMVGAFAISEIIKLYTQQKGIVAEKIQITGSRRKAVGHLIRNKLLILRSTALGFVIGAIPGVGGTVANYLAYGQAVQMAKDPENFGKGDVRGVIGPETANNAKDVGQLVPTLALGIPGSGTMAVFLGAMTLHGVVPGPFVMRDHMDVVLMISLTLAIAFMLSCLAVVFLGGYFSRILDTNINILCIFILILAFIATYFVRYEIPDVFVMLIFGVLGYITVRLKGSPILLILPLILGDIVEHNFILTQEISLGKTSYFFSPISIFLIILTLLSVIFPILRGRQRGKNA